MSGDSYASWSAIQAALKATAQREISEGRASGHDLSQRLTQARFDRFLSRVFADGGERWMLKGGTAMLARIPDTRATRDIDLGTSQDLDEAIHDLTERARVDLGDHVTFTLAGLKNTGLGDNQPGVSLKKVIFVATDSQTGKKIGDVSVDVAVTPAPVGTPELLEPASRLQLPKPLQSSPWRLYPLSDHIADKVRGVMSRYGESPSTRVKDLVDLVTIARTQTVNARELQLALASKILQSNVPADVSEFRVPDTWRSASGTREFKRLAGMSPARGISKIQEAEDLVAELVTPALAPEPIPDEVRWTPTVGWEATPDSCPASTGDPIAGVGAVWVREHIRGGWPVREHTRGPRGRS
ncbi:nucleotidyl transferase AbiEii/AbiGii toxin family protein [Arthrobacter woluwensis]|uniref:nucleotidyl transferase AbiEii/AbiGii toxin family protein n=1 Tax=Arthrobacter woluwensis TaxID=156980 RepID=UPI003813B794